MLDDLDRIDWSSLSHPLYGKADGVIPKHLRGLLDERHSVREDCYQELHEYLVGRYDQLSEAALTVVPFLMEIATSDEEGRGYAALLLCVMGRAGRMGKKTVLRDLLGQHRDSIRTWRGPVLVDARAYLLSCLDRFETPEDRPERKVLRALWRALSAETDEE